MSEAGQERGVVLCAVGDRFVAMAAAVLEGLRRHAPGLPVILYTGPGEVTAGYDAVVRLENPWRRSKLDVLLASPFERTLFLDVDLFVVNPIGDVLDLLDAFDLALAHDAERNSTHATRTWRRPLPDAFPQFNTGVIAYRRSSQVLDCFRAWRDAVVAADAKRDQPFLRELLYESRLRVATLPREYNYAITSDLLFFRQFDPAPRILHYYREKRPDTGAVRVPRLDDMLSPAAVAILEQMSRGDLGLAAEAGKAPAQVKARTKQLMRLRAFAELGLRRFR